MSISENQSKNSGVYRLEFCFLSKKSIFVSISLNEGWEKFEHDSC